MLRFDENDREIIEANYTTVLQISDLDNDAVFDLVLYSHRKAQLLWCKGMAKNKFSPPAVIAENLKDVKSLRIVDFNQDRLLDIMPVFHFHRVSKIHWYKNNGQGTFTRKDDIEIPEGVYINEIITSDLDRDRDIDICYVSRDKKTYEDLLVWLENNGKGHFVQKAILLEKILLENFVLVDFDKDGDQDLFFKGMMYDYVYKNEKNTFSSFQKLPAKSAIVEFFIITDLDNNGYVDILMGNHRENQISLYLNDGKNIQNEKIVNESPGTPMCIEAKDLDGDGLNDLIGATGKWSKVFWKKNDLKNFIPYQDILLAL